jgi:hypothetical protein
LYGIEQEKPARATPAQCWNCGSTEHLKSACPTAPNFGARSQPSAFAPAKGAPPSNTQHGCYACGSPTHAKRNCPHLMKACDNCGRVGHLKATCRAAQRQGE